MLYIFNPSCEMAVRSDTINYTPPSIIQKMEEDLACIVMLLTSSKDDYVLSDRPDEQLLNIWFSDTDCPQFITRKEFKAKARAGEMIMPWGANRSIYNLMGRKDEWKLRNLMSRKTSVTVERTLSRHTDFWGFDAAPEIVTSTQQLEKLLNSDYNCDVVLKSLWSASGRGVRFFSPSDFWPALDYAGRTIKADGAIVLEKKLKRIAECSILLYADGENIHPWRMDIEECINVYKSADGGSLGQEIAGAGRLQLFNELLPANWLQTTITNLCQAFSTVMTGSGYVGPIGTDAMLYTSNNGDIKLRPCMEANIRYCMGNIGVMVNRHLCTGSSAIWGMQSFSKDGGMGAFLPKEARRDASNIVIRQ